VLDPLLAPVEWPEKKTRRNLNRKNLENPVKKACLALLARLQKQGSVRLYERRNNIALDTTDGGRVFAGVKGRADIWAVVRTEVLFPQNVQRTLQHVEIECKRADGKGRLSNAQSRFKAECDLKRIPNFIVTSVEELVEQLRDLGVCTEGANEPDRKS
jgi:hypothetical protein